MNIQIEVTGDSLKSVRTNIKINGISAGTLDIAPSDFAKFCDRLFGEGYTIAAKAPVVLVP